MDSKRAAEVHADEPLWLLVAKHYIGTRELLPSGELNPLVRGFFAHTGFPSASITKTTAWCAAFVSTCLEVSGVRSTHSASARSYQAWGKPCDPMLGAVLVFARGDNPMRGHVAFCAGAEGDRVLALGGNQRNSVCIVERSLADVVACRWPAA